MLVLEPEGPWFKSHSDHGIFLGKTLIPRFLLSIQEYKWVPVRENEPMCRGCILRHMLTDDFYSSDQGVNVKVD
ncbi:hypothetical protein DPMN_171758 [Dreissena polymorpha]|uniref:Uncharacterized protein n=1 Tax=Dreissena polymorpha TaxID=45954 RepID=A0A9D4E0Y5_DREPO|nr:hypothetical protein DPMN_171758 [Dreissena polymorpha]